MTAGVRRADDCRESPPAVLVESRLHDWRALPATVADRVLIRDETYQRHAGPRRYFWLLDEGVQMVYEPFGWRDEWYVDIVRIDVHRSGSNVTYRITDQYLDFVVEGMGPTYRLLDLDQLAQAMAAGHIDVAGAGRAMVHAQQFAERYLHRGAPFPPPQIRPFFSTDHQHPPPVRP